MLKAVNLLLSVGYTALSAILFLVTLVLGPNDRAAEVIWETKRDLMRR